ncbi:WD repeat-containing protein 75 [Denticeps clupeoides]|uniref:WD repeat-containing protein 75 second beta-propeller domain-containing protein n=1 Tax=Denticeps clupeoides TaxID=299321 RepID=A0AAY4EHE4_9TELE|nr:WD repeat-containing protein 75 [Denticeps clupeoides]
MVESSEVRVVRCGGSRINVAAPVISVDSRFLLCASGDLVKVFSTSTEEWVHVLQGHTNVVTGITLNPANQLQVYSSSADGTVRLWDFTDGILIKTFVIGYPIATLLVSNKHEGILFLVVPAKDNSNSECLQLVAAHVPKTLEQEVEVRELSSVLPNISPNPRAVGFGREGEYIASAEGLKLIVYFFRDQKPYRFNLSKSTKKGAKNTFTCVSCHPKDDCVATGHEDGKIRLWRNFNQKKEYTYTTLHWHHSVVNTLCFTPEGTTLLSGGIESVLVQWQYDRNSKYILPRLGGSITHISVSADGSLFTTSHSDNKITVIQSNLKVSAVIQGLVKGEAVHTDLVIDPRSKALVLNGKPGHLQFYSLQRDKQLYNLDIVQQEYIYQEGLDQYEVVKAAFDAHGSCLATVEERGKKLSDTEITLKFWDYNETAQSFVLNTTVMTPHDNRITSMCFFPTAETTMVVTTARDGCFKAWLLGQESDTEKQGTDGPSWSCDFVGRYHDLQPTNCCFSADGSLLAVSFQEVITIWNPETWELLTTLCQPPGNIKDLCFGRLSCSRYLLATTTKNMLCCWNLLTCSLEWSTSIAVTLLKADPLSENMAVFTLQKEQTDLFVFKPCEPRPLFTQNALCVGEVQRAIFVPREEPLDNCDESSLWLNRSQLYCLTENMDLLAFTTKIEDDSLISRKLAVIDDSVAVTPFYLLLGKHRQREQEMCGLPVTEQQGRAQLPQGSVAVRELLHTAAHVLPPASFLCNMFVKSLLISQTGVKVETEPSEQQAESEKEEEESEEEMDSCDAQQDRRVQGLGVETVPLISKAQERELKKVRRTDYSWLSCLSDS